jgi:hypothetical protein
VQEGHHNNHSACHIKVAVHGESLKNFSYQFKKMGQYSVSEQQKWGMLKTAKY